MLCSRTADTTQQVSADLSLHSSQRSAQPQLVLYTFFVFRFNYYFLTLQKMTLDLYGHAQEDRYSQRAGVKTTALSGSGEPGVTPGTKVCLEVEASGQEPAG